MDTDASPNSEGKKKGGNGNNKMSPGEAARKFVMWGVALITILFFTMLIIACVSISTLNKVASPTGPEKTVKNNEIGELILSLLGITAALVVGYGVNARSRRAAADANGGATTSADA